MKATPATANRAYVPIRRKRTKRKVVFQHQRFHSIIATRPGSFDTDTTRTRDLWALVRSIPANMPTASSRDRKQPSQRTTSTDPANNLPGGRNYGSSTLQPRGITIDLSKYAPRPAFAYFNTDAPPAGPSTTRLAHYTRIPELRRSTLWLEPTDCPAIIARYQILHRQGCGQGEWVLEALQSLLKWEGRPLPADSSSSSGPHHLPVRLFCDAFTPARPAEHPPLWRAPPSSNPPHHATAPPLDATPTVSYWLWAGGFGAFALGTDALAARAHLRYDHALCPYLSVAVHAAAAPATRQAGRDELAAAAAIALFNACELLPPGSAARRHFGVLLAGPHYECWCVVPEGKNGWKGCRMGRVAGGALDCPAALAALMDWLNEIHRWGNTVYAGACVAAVHAFDRAEEDEGVVLPEAV